MRKLLLAVLVTVVGCGDPTGPLELDPLTSDAAGEFSGTWKAAQVDLFYGVTFNLTEKSPTEITGTWAGFTPCASFLAGASPLCRPRSGLVTAGTRNGDNITLTMSPDDMPCGYGFFIEVTRSGTAATGTARAINCDGSRHTWASPVTLKR